MSLNDAQIKEALWENKILFTQTVDGIPVARGLIATYWPKIPQMDLDAAVRFVKLYTSTANYPTPSNTVTNPTIKGKNIRTGVYRCVEVKLAVVDDGSVQLVRILRDTAAGADYSWAAVRSKFTSEDRHTWLGKDTKGGSPAQADGKIFRVVNTLSPEDASYDYDETTVTALPVDTAGITFVRANSQGQAEEYDYRNQSAAPTVPTNTRRSKWRGGFRVNDFGRYDGAISHDQTVSLAFGPYLSSASAQENEYAYDYENRDAPLDVPTGEEGRSAFRRDPDDDTWSGTLRLRRVQTGASVWWGGTGETVFHYIDSRTGRDIYVYDRYTRSLSTAETHLQAEVSCAGAIVIGWSDGHRTDIFPLGSGRLQARRVEQL